MPEAKDRGGIICRLDGPVGQIILNRPERHNAFDGEMLDALGQALNELEAAAECRVILIRGEGPSFCAGWDTQSFGQLAGLGEDGLKAAFARNAAVMDQLAASSRIILCAIHGACMGFGIGLAARSDLCIATASARFALPELSHGIVPGMVLGDAIQSLGARTAMDWVLSREVRSAEQARNDGLVSRITPDDDFEAQVGALATHLAKAPAAAVAATKTLARSHGAATDFQARAIAASTASVLSLIRKPASS
jgi:methylglutaconyl-CoA hydratase